MKRLCPSAKITSKASEDFPEPEGPVTTTNLFGGMSGLMFLRLFSRAPRIFKSDLPLHRGGASSFFPDEPFGPGDFRILEAGVDRLRKEAGEPCAIIFPPLSPAPGPSSTIHSHP